MKYLLYISILLCFAACGTAESSIDDNEMYYSPQYFTKYSDDSIQNYLSDKWIRCGQFVDNRILPDTLGDEFVYYTKTKEESYETVFIDQTGEYRIVNDEVVKQIEVLSLSLSFVTGTANLLETHCTIPDFASCTIEQSLFISRLLVKNGKFYNCGMDDTTQINLFKLNEDLIVIENKVYVRAAKWKVKAANKN